MATVFVAGGAEGRNCSRNVPECSDLISIYISVPLYHSRNVSIETEQTQDPTTRIHVQDYGYVEVGDEVWRCFLGEGSRFLELENCC